MCMGASIRTRVQGAAYSFKEVALMKNEAMLVLCLIAGLFLLAQGGEPCDRWDMGGRNPKQS